MMPDICIAAIIAFVVGMIVGVILFYNVGEPKCKHEFERIIDDRYPTAHIVVHMCTKCGKKKITKV